MSRQDFRSVARSVATVVAMAAALPAAVPVAAAFDEAELGCLALNVYHEARGESVRGQRAVAAVTLNRVRSPKFPSSICAVVWQPRQFSWTHTRRSYFPGDDAAWRKALEVARESLEPEVAGVHENVLYYHSKRVRPRWTRNVRFVERVGSHLFYAS